MSEGPVSEKPVETSLLFGDMKKRWLKSDLHTGYQDDHDVKESRLILKHKIV